MTPPIAPPDNEIRWTFAGRVYVIRPRRDGLDGLSGFSDPGSKRT